jgi:hypothetical protein
MMAAAKGDEKLAKTTIHLRFTLSPQIKKGHEVGYFLCGDV